MRYVCISFWPCLGQGFYWYFCFFSIINHLWGRLSGNTSILQWQSKTVSFFPLQNKCVGVFVKELKSILSNMTVQNDERDTLTGIQTLLQKLEDQQPAAHGQQVSLWRNSRVFSQTVGPDCSPVTSPPVGSRRDVIHDNLLFLFQDGRTCLMKASKNSLAPLKQFINFVRHLNRNTTELQDPAVCFKWLFLFEKKQKIWQLSWHCVTIQNFLWKKNYIINIFLMIFKLKVYLCMVYLFI